MIERKTETKFKRTLINHYANYFKKAICLMIAFQLASCSSSVPEENNLLVPPTEWRSPATVSPPLEIEPMPNQRTLRTNTPSPTFTPLPTNTALPTNFAPPTPTYPPIATPYQMPNDFPAFVINAYYPENEIIVFNSNGDINHQLILDDNSSVRSVSDGLQPCELLITIRAEDEIRILRYQLRDQHTELFYKLPLGDTENWIGYVSLSPNKKWISYSVFSGAERYSGSEFQDIEVISVADSEKRYRLTSFGGALEPAAWSSDGERIALSDYDSMGKQQLVVVEPDGQNRRIVQTFEGQNTRIGNISWSPNDEQVVYIVYKNYGLENSDFQPELWVADLMNKSNIQIELPIVAQFFHGTTDWSENGDQFLVWFVSFDNYSGFFRVNIRTSSVEYLMDGRSLRNLNPPITVEFPFIVSTDLSRIGFLNGNNLRIFDTVTERITGLDFSTLSDWLEPLSVTPLRLSYKYCR
jgi:hypothetical protein